MKICDLSKNMSLELKMIIIKYARHLVRGCENAELTIHKDRTVSVICDLGYIMYREKMTGDILAEAKRISRGVVE